MGWADVSMKHKIWSCYMWLTILSRSHCGVSGRDCGQWVEVCGKSTKITVPPSHDRDAHGFLA
jgi:hypothetical protein